MTKEVIIVDDSSFMRNLLEQILDDEYDVVAQASNGVEAVELYKEHNPDFVMMDVVMPKCNGIKATHAIKQLDDSHIIMCTSVGQKEKMKLAVQAGADGYVTKPFEEEDVLQTVQKVVE